VVVHAKREISLQPGGIDAIIVMGVAGSGKSTLGAAVAHTLNCPFMEGDDFHTPEAVARMRAAIPLTDDDRWPWLDRLGRALSDELVRHGIAVATCSALRRAYRDRLREVIPARVSFVLMDADPEELLRRLTARKHHYMPPSLLVSQLGTLERPQPDEAAITLDARRPPAALCEQIVAWLSKREK
jgi:gluconokinase